MTKKIATFDSREAAQYCSPRRKPWVCGKWPSPGRGEKMSHTCGNVLLHVIFSTHQRRPLIKPEFRADLFAYLGGIIREMSGTALIINGTADHVHMLIRIRPSQAPAENCADRKNKFIALGSRTLCELRLANRIRSLQRERIRCLRRNEIHCGTGRTSQ
jgi:REP element-mobilizing transposase RayT